MSGSGWIAVSAITLMTLATTAPDALAGKFAVLYNFQNVNSGGTIPGSVVVGKHGMIFGTTFSGGTEGLGEVYKLDLDGMLTVLHVFQGNGDDGGYPSGVPILRGNTLFGQAHYGVNNQGIIYSVNTDGSNFKILYQVGGTIVADNNAIIYGINRSILFRLNPNGKFEVLESFAGQDDFLQSLVIDDNSNLFGVNGYIDANGNRCDVFEYPAGGHTAITIYSVEEPPAVACSITLGGLDSNGVVYGYTRQRSGKKNLTGTLFSLTSVGSSYAYTLLHDFTHSQTEPTSLAVSETGLLTGTSISYLARKYLKHTGELFQVVEGHYSVLHRFEFKGSSSSGELAGSYPSTVPFVINNGDIVGSTWYGGEEAHKKTTCSPQSPYYQGCGTIYTYKP